MKNAETQQSRAAAALSARSRWAITGTPIQNHMKGAQPTPSLSTISGLRRGRQRVVRAYCAHSMRCNVSTKPLPTSADLYGILAFLHMEPLAQRAVFRAALERPLAIGDTSGMLRLRLLLASTAMRRLKTTTVGGRAIVALPPKTVEIVKVELGGEQRRAYDTWEEAGRAVIAQHLEAEQLLQNYASVLEIILRCARLLLARAQAGVRGQRQGASASAAKARLPLQPRRVCLWLTAIAPRLHLLLPLAATR